MADDSDDLEVASNAQVWLAAEEPVDGLLRDISPTWTAELQTILSASPYDVVSLALAEHDDHSVVVVDLGIDREPLSSEVQLLGSQIAQTIWPDRSFILKPIDFVNGIGPGTTIYRCCGGIGSHTGSCPLLKPKDID